MRIASKKNSRKMNHRKFKTKKLKVQRELNLERKQLPLKTRNNIHLKL